MKENPNWASEKLGELVQELNNSNDYGGPANQAEITRMQNDLIAVELPPVTSAQLAQPARTAEPTPVVLPAGVVGNTGPVGVQGAHRDTPGHQGPIGPSSTQKRFMFTGLTGAGKDYVAQRAGLKVLDPFELARSLAVAVFGNVPEGALVSFTNTVLAWGEGEISNKFPLDASRYNFLRSFRDEAPEGFGTQGFWVRELLKKANESNSNVAVTKVESEIAFNMLMQANFKHWHVITDGTTYAQRARRTDANDGLSAGIEKDLQQKLTFPPPGMQNKKFRVIWNSGLQYLHINRVNTLEQFCSLI